LEEGEEERREGRREDKKFAWWSSKAPDLAVKKHLGSGSSGPSLLLIPCGQDELPCQAVP
jgi:hypothetical protein